MLIIDRTIINPNLTLKYLNYGKTFTYSELISLINRAKTYLIQEKNVQPGQKVIICGGDFYIPWFFACSELGLIFVMASHARMHPDWLEFNQLYGTIHWVIHDPKESFDEYNQEYKNETIDMNILKTYYNSSCKNVTYATQDFELTWSISDRSDWKKKAVVSKHTHKFYHDLMIRNISILGITEIDRCLHSRILHHGSSLGVYFLPTINICTNHYWVTEYDENWTKKVLNEKIKYAFLFGDMLSTFNNSINSVIDLSSLTIFCIQFLNDTIIDNLINTCNATIISVFGSTATSGPVFLQTTNQTNSLDYDSTNFFKPLDDFYKLKIENNMLVIDTPNYGLVYSCDQFEIKNGNYHFIPYED